MFSQGNNFYFADCPQNLGQMVIYYIMLNFMYLDSHVCLTAFNTE